MRRTPILAGQIKKKLVYSIIILNGKAHTIFMMCDFGLTSHDYS